MFGPQKAALSACAALETKSVLKKLNFSPKGTCDLQVVSS